MRDTGAGALRPGHSLTDEGPVPPDPEESPIPAADPIRPAPVRQRSHGVVRLRVAPAGSTEGRPGPTRIVDLAESGPLRLRVPRQGAEAMLEGVLVNTGGGIACGDRFAVEVTVEARN